MQLPTVINTDELLVQIAKNELYQNLVLQLNKDFELSGIEANFEQNNTPTELFIHLQDILSFLLQKRFDDFLTILYRIDINENQIKDIINSMAEDTEKQISFLILKREWQKVWFKKFYS